MNPQDSQPVAAVPAAPLAAAETPRARLWPAVGVLTHLTIILTLGTLVLLTYANSFNTGFALDNKFILLEDPRLRGHKPDTFHLIFTQDYWYPKAVSGLYRPLTTLSYWANYTGLGNAEHPTGYHLINFLLHWFNAVLVYFLVLVLMGNTWPAFFVAALFSAHPVATESVTNIVGRADLFATLAVLGGFLLYAKSTMVGGWRKVPWLIGLTVLTGLGVFCKESAAAVLGVMLLYDVVFRFRQRSSAWYHFLMSAAAALAIAGAAGWWWGWRIALIVVFLAVAGGLLLRWFATLRSLQANFWTWVCQGYIALLPPYLALMWVRHQVFDKLRPAELPWVDNPLTYHSNPLFEHVSRWDWWATSRITAIKVIGKYFWLLLWPQELSCDYSYNQIPLVNWRFANWEDWKAVVALVAILVAVLVAIRQFRRNKALAFFILLFFVALLPTSNLLFVMGSIMGERFLYLPLIGYCGVLVISIYALCRRYLPRLNLSDWAIRVWLQTLARSLLALMVAGYGLRAFFRNFDWQNDVELWKSAVQVCPDSFKTHKSYAFALYEQDPLYKDIDKIIDEGEKAKAITDQTQIVLLHLGAYYRIQGDKLAQHAADGSLVYASPQSAKWYRKSVEVLQQAVPLDHAFNEDNRRQEIARGHKSADIQDIGNHEIYYNLGLSYMRLAQYQQALDAYRYMQHLAPTNPDAYQSMASVYLAASQPSEAAICLLQTLLLDNNRQDALRLLIELYRQIDRQGCAISVADGPAKLNVDCQIVRDHMCAAYYGLVQVFLQSKQFALAQQTRSSALQNYKCAPEAFDKLFATYPPPAKS